jgi:hypothetical protein
MSPARDIPADYHVAWACMVMLSTASRGLRHMFQEYRAVFPAVESQGLGQKQHYSVMHDATYL